MNTQNIVGTEYKRSDYLIQDLSKLTGRIGVLGGSFDPVHLDHIGMAESAAKTLKLDAIVYLPTPQNPLKEAQLFDDQERIELLLQAITGKKNTYVCTLEIEDAKINKKEAARTVDTLDLINSNKNPKSEIFFLLGADCLPDLHKWKNFHELFKKASIVPVRRDFTKDQMIEALKSGAHLTEGEIQIINENWVDFETANAGGDFISSTSIRERLNAGEIPSSLLPAGVTKYLSDNY